MKCANAAGSCASTVFVSVRSMRLTRSRLTVLTKLSVMPLLCGLHTGVLTGVRPSELAMCLVSCAI